MACATLKRSLDWENLNQRPTKRRRCNPFGQTTGSPSSSSSLRAGGAATVASSSHHSAYDAFGNASITAQGNNTPSSCRKNATTTAASAFSDACISKISSENMARNIHEEIKRLHKQKQLPFTNAAIERMQDSESSGSEMGPDSPRRPESPPTIVRNPEKALFNFKQVQLICERMLKEREEEIREKYDAVLTTKLAEQYDAFVKFTYDQIQKRYEAAPSYLS